MRGTHWIVAAFIQCVALSLLSPMITRAEPRVPRPDAAPRSESYSFKLASFNSQEVADSQETSTVTITETSDNHWEIEGPVFLRSADPEPPGEVIVKNIFGWETTKGGGSDDFEYELEIEWGIVQDHELIFELPFEIGDGHVEGNGDLTLGWHWRLWDEQDALPAFAMRNLIRVPTGVDSSGVDYTWRGLFTKTLIPGTMRLHVNPFLSSINGENEEDARPFRWGTAIGVDYRLADDLLLVTDYKYENGQFEHTRDNHSAEFGLDWRIADHQKLGFALEVGLDGDSEGPSLGAKISYMFSFGG